PPHMDMNYGVRFFQPTSEFTGKGIINTYDWTTLTHDDFPNFYLLFTRAGAELVYATGGISQGCGAGVNFNYSYTLDN
ncbi:hypothetical protein LI168_15820, partial [Desulfovibrio desulfuricans]|uniref:hypothetical protein n=1 Tax=Desulfovibrio desulfuricans TaxID=876 RepID=UPI001D07F166